MRKSHGGVAILATNIVTEVVIEFQTKSAASRYYGCSLRTVSRRLESGTTFTSINGDSVIFSYKI